ncbi:MAG: glycosyltransferase [Pseudomonadota bacterium]
MTVAAVVIGRNEGERLLTCLASIQDHATPIIYVDSGSTDGSLAAAKAAGADVVALDLTKPFTAARARNAGLARLGPEIAYVQVLDGDCELRDGWLAEAIAFLEAHPQAAVACGRRRERYPEASVYNRLIDLEWDTPIGQTKACGGDALLRCEAVRSVGGYRDDLIAGEEPELCVRLRQAGWEVWRLDAEMTWHDAALSRFAQWWRRSVRAGHAFAEGAALHGAAPERHWVRETRRAVMWGAVFPSVVMLAALFISPWALLSLFAYPAQVFRLRNLSGIQWAIFNILGKFPEAIGVVKFWANSALGARSRIIEYK